LVSRSPKLPDSIPIHIDDIADADHCFIETSGERDRLLSTTFEPPVGLAQALRNLQTRELLLKRTAVAVPIEVVAGGPVQDAAVTKDALGAGGRARSQRR